VDPGQPGSVMADLSKKRPARPDPWVTGAEVSTSRQYRKGEDGGASPHVEEEHTGRDGRAGEDGGISDEADGAASWEGRGGVAVEPKWTIKVQPHETAMVPPKSNIADERGCLQHLLYVQDE
jgi:hypothetical protein